MCDGSIGIDLNRKVEPEGEMLGILLGFKGKEKHPDSQPGKSTSSAIETVKTKDIGMGVTLAGPPR